MSTHLVSLFSTPLTSPSQSGESRSFISPSGCRRLDSIYVMKKKVLGGHVHSQVKNENKNIWGAYAHSRRANVMSTSRLHPKFEVNVENPEQSSAAAENRRLDIGRLLWSNSVSTVTCGWGQRTNLVRGEAGYHQQNTKAGVTAVDYREKSESRMLNTGLVENGVMRTVDWCGKQ